MLKVYKIKRLVSQISRYILNQGVGISCVDAILAHDPQGVDDLKNCTDPCFYYKFLTDCLLPSRFTVKVIKSSGPSASQPYMERFNFLTEALRKDPHVIPYAYARTIGLAADQLFGNYNPKGHGDIAAHCKRSSSFANKGSLLATIVRHMCPKLCLELGTAYGMSGMFILSTLQQLKQSGELHTVEMTTLQYDLSHSILREAFGEKVHCHHGATQDIVPNILASVDKIDFVFHDAGHCYENYVNDFALMEPSLSDGAVVLLDDIRWDNPNTPGENDNTYKGWREIVDHPRVSRALEINKKQGLVLLGEFNSQA